MVLECCTNSKATNCLWGDVAEQPVCMPWDPALTEQALGAVQGGTSKSSPKTALAVLVKVGRQQLGSV